MEDLEFDDIFAPSNNDTSSSEEIVNDLVLEDEAGIAITDNSDVFIAPDENKVELTKPDANKFLMALNIVMNNVNSYGPAHPSTIEKAKDFCEIINNFVVDEVSLMRNGDSLYLENIAVDSGRFNVKRTIGQFDKLEVVSITFRKGVTNQEIIDFFNNYTVIYATYNEEDFDKKAIEIVEEKIKENNIQNILVNYITYEKVTKDEVIIGNDIDLSELPINENPSGNSSNAGKRVSLKGGAGLKDTVNWDKILNGSSNILELLFNSGDKEHTIDIKELSQKLNILGVDNTLNDDKLDDKDKLETVIDSLVKISEALQKSEEISSEISKIETREETLDRVEQLTFNTMTQLIRKEFESGTPSVGKLAEILKRIAPNKKELSKLLPLLKHQLLEDGYSLSDFLNLTLAIDENVSEDSAMDRLLESAEEFGIEKDEIIDAIIENPSESSKILIQMAEIQKRAGKNNQAISDVLSKIISEMSTTMVVNDVNSLSENDTKGAMNSISGLIKDLERNIVDTIADEDDIELSEELKKKLDEDFEKKVLNVKEKIILNAATKSEGTSTDVFIETIEKVSETQEEKQELVDRFYKSGKTFGLSEDEVNRVLNRVAKSKEIGERLKGLHILPAKSTIFMIKNYIELFKRYGHPFSLVMISSKDKSNDDLEFIEHILLYITNNFRSLDIVGRVKIKNRLFPVIILPMTSSQGLLNLQKRFSAIPIAVDYFISAISIDSYHRLTNYELIMKKLLKKHIEKDVINKEKK